MKKQNPVNKRTLTRQQDHIVMPARRDGVTRSARTILAIKRNKNDASKK